VVSLGEYRSQQNEEMQSAKINRALTESERVRVKIHGDDNDDDDVWRRGLRAGEGHNFFYGEDGII
jgi:hypothetical protein